MSTSQYILALVGPTMVLVGVSMLVNPKFFDQLMKDLSKNMFNFLLAGMMSFVIGLAILFASHKWGTIDQIIVSVLGWLSVLKGVLYILMPKLIGKMTNWFTGNVRVWGIVELVLGAWFCSLAFA